MAIPAVAIGALTLAVLLPGGASGAAELAGSKTDDKETPDRFGGMEGMRGLDGLLGDLESGPALKSLGDIHQLLSQVPESAIANLLQSDSTDSSADRHSDGNRPAYRGSSVSSASSSGGKQSGKQSGNGPTTSVHVETQIEAHINLGAGATGASQPAASSDNLRGTGSRAAANATRTQGGDAADDEDRPPMSAAEKLAKEFQYAMVRIQSISEGFNWFRPFFPGQESSAVGSGFAVVLNAKGSSKIPHDVENDPVFVTNAHVVRNAHTVRIQLPAMGQQDFGAYVPMIYDKLDLALVRLQEPKEFLKNLKDNNVNLKILPIREDPMMSMGMEVAALGFPLGSQTLKLSRGVIAGTEQVEGKLCFQSTAPISPGSSGGPLFAVEALDGGIADPQVIGVNFAAASSRTAQNDNYVVPLVHIRQLLNEFEIVDVKEQKEYQAWKKMQEAEMAKREEMMKKQQQMVEAYMKQHQGQAKSQGSQTQDSGSQTQDSESGPSGPGEDMLGTSDGSSTDSNSKMALIQFGGQQQLTHSGSGADSGRLFQMQTDLLSPFLRSESRPSPQMSQQKLPERSMRHHSMKIAPVIAISVESNDLLYKGKCKKGIFLAKIPLPSVLDAIPAQSFLEAVDDAPLDQFGMGRHQGYLDNPLPFHNLMAMNDKLEDTVKLTVCKDGVVKDYQVDMAWQQGNASKYDLGVAVVEEPFYHPTAKDFETFAGVTVAELTVNHIMQLLNSGADARLGRFLDPEARKTKRLLVVHTQSGTYSSRVLGPGMLISKINDRNVTGLSSWIEAIFFSEEGMDFKLETDEGVIFKVPFGEEYARQATMAQQVPQFRYLYTKGLCLKDSYQQLAKKLSDPRVVQQLAQQIQEMRGKAMTQEELLIEEEHMLVLELMKQCQADIEEVTSLMDAIIEKQKQAPAQMAGSFKSALMQTHADSERRFQKDSSFLLRHHK